jgi:hypothetical protein
LFLKCSSWWLNLTNPHNAQHLISVKVFKLKRVQSLKSSFLECQLQSYGWNCWAHFFYIITKYVFCISFWWTNIWISKKLKYQCLPWPKKKSENDFKEEKRGEGLRNTNHYSISCLSGSHLKYVPKNNKKKAFNTLQKILAIILFPLKW